MNGAGVALDGAELVVAVSGVHECEVVLAGGCGGKDCARAFH